MPIRAAASASVVALAMIAPADIAAAVGLPCATRGSITVAASRTVRVYTVPKRDTHGRRRNFGALPGRTFGCRYRDDKRIPLGADGDRVLGSFHIAGNFVAFNASAARYTTGTQIVEAFDLARGRMTFRNDVPGGGVPGLVIARSGSLAWIRTGPGEGAQVLKHEAGVGVTVLDPGPAVGAGSLALGGPSSDFQTDTVYWTTADGPRSAPLKRETRRRTATAAPATTP
jgi:hypothetical protein